MTTYAGQIRDGHACGLGVATYSSGTKEYAEHGPDGQFDGRWLRRWADGDTEYYLCERGKRKAFAYVYADGRCQYNGEACAPDDPRLLALIAQVAPVEVRPAARAPHPPPATRRPLPPKQSSDGSAGSVCPRRRWRPPWPPRCTPILHAVAGVRATQPNSSRTATREACTLFHANNRRLLHTNGPVLAASLPRHSPARRLLNAATRGRLYVSMHRPNAEMPPPAEPSCQALRLSPSRVGVAGRGSRGQPATALGGARALRPPSWAGYLWGYSLTPGACRSTHGVLQGCSLTLRVHRQGTTRSEDCVAVGRARLPFFNDRRCGCRGSSCS
jgi:hypothetical protein